MRDLPIRIRATWPLLAATLAAAAAGAGIAPARADSPVSDHTSTPRPGGQPKERKSPMNTGPGWLNWTPADTGTDHDWEMPGVNAGAAHTVEYRRGDQPGSAIIIYLYPAWYGGQPGEFWVQCTFEWIHGEDPRNPVGTETWSDSGGTDLLGTYRTLDDAAGAAARIAALLARCDYDALDAIEPGLYQDPLEWDGTPYDKEPVTAP